MIAAVQKAEGMPVGDIRSGIRSEQQVKDRVSSACPEHDCFSY